MMDRLRARYLYCEKRPRDFVFGAVETIVNGPSQRKLLLHRLRRLAAERANAEAMRRGYLFTNWEMAARTTLNAMLLSGSVLTQGGQAIEPGIAAEGSEIAALHPDFVDRTERFLLEYLIRDLGDVTVRDHTALAHALFRQFDASVAMEEMEDRVAELLSGLADSVALNDHGTYTFREPA